MIIEQTDLTNGLLAYIDENPGVVFNDCSPGNPRWVADIVDPHHPHKLARVRLVPGVSKIRDCRMLTREDYRVLAARSLAPGLNTLFEPGLTALLLYLTLGALGEYGEFQEDPSLEEAGDVLWYCELLLQYLSTDPRPMRPVPGWDTYELVKKAWVHHRPVPRETVTGWIRWIYREVLWYIEDSGSSVEEVYADNIRKLGKRFPYGFAPGGGAR